MTSPREEPPAVGDDDLDWRFASFADGTISDADCSALESLLAGNRGARDAFRTWMTMEAALAWDLAIGDEPRLAAGISPDRPARGLGRFAAGFLLPLTLLLGGLAAAGVFLLLGTRVTAVGHARLIDVSDDARWVGDGVVARGAALPSGPLRLAQGAAMVRFSSGALVTVNAPAAVEILGPNRLFLRQGGIVPFVPPKASGFTVVSPNGEVIDLGTEFSVRVDRDGGTDVYVIDGEVDVAGGHGPPQERLRLTQGFATSLRTPAISAPEFTQQPLILEHFDTARDANAASAGSTVLRWRNIDVDAPAEIQGGGLRVPIVCREGKNYPPIARVILDHDFTPLVGRRSKITCKVTLPNVGTAPPDRWAGVALDCKSKTPQMVYSADTVAGVLVSPRFQSLVLAKGEKVARGRVFSRAEDTIGPYQLVLAIDDTPQAREAFGSGTLDVTINGREIIRDCPIEIGEKPRVILQTNTLDEGGGRGYAVFDDMCVSVEGWPTAQAVEGEVGRTEESPQAP